MNINSAVVLAAGEGTRLRPLTSNRPKPMLPAADRAILDHVLAALIDARIDDLHLVVGYKRERVQNHVGPTFQNRSVTYHVQNKQLGSGHALLQAQDAIDSDFVVINGDQIAASQLIERVVEAHSHTDRVTMGVRESDQISNYGAVEVDDDRIVELVERPREGTYRLMNAGIYAFDPAIFSDLEGTERQEGELAITDAITANIGDQSAVRGVHTEGLWIDATYPWDLPRVARELLSSGLLDPPERSDGHYVANGAAIHESAVLQGPVVVTQDAVVGPNTVVGPHTAVGRNATVNAGAVVRRSIIDTDARVGPNATISDSVLGQRANLGDGVVLSSDTTEVRVGDRIHTDVRLGAVVADGARLGGNVSVVPGSLIGPDATVLPGSHVDGNIDEGVEVRR